MLQHSDNKGTAKVTGKYILTEEGDDYLSNGLPEARLVEDVVSGAPSMKELQEKPYFRIGLMWAKKNGWIKVDNGKITLTGKGKEEQGRISAIEFALMEVKNGKRIDEAEAKQLVSRKLIEERKSAPNMKEILQLTPEIIKSGIWKNTPFKDYDVELNTPPAPMGKKHVLREALDNVSRILIEMGFKEMEGTMVDSEFYVYDCLFMPQDHPARTAWDQFTLKRPKQVKSLPNNIVRKVKAAHETGGDTDSTGWGYHWEKEAARRLVLRGHTTAVTSHYLINHNKPPNRFFMVDKVFRKDAIDRTHLIEFYQIEGWVMDKNLTVRDLMGMFKEFYRRFGIKDIKFKPTFNPYTEPSFEIYGKHPKLGKWLEIGNSGMFREEMLNAFGVDSTVIAWGLALERLVMLLYNYDDIRNVHGTLCDIDFLRTAPAMWKY